MIQWLSSLFTGVDPRIKVTYKPLERYREQSGILSKTISYTMKQLTVIKNTLSERAIITLTDHVPRSQEEKLKVSNSSAALICVHVVLVTQFILFLLC